MSFDGELRLEFHGSKVTSDAGLPAYRELVDAPWLTEMAEKLVGEWRTGKNTQHAVIAVCARRGRCAFSGRRKRPSMLPGGSDKASGRPEFVCRSARAR